MLLCIFQMFGESKHFPHSESRPCRWLWIRISTIDDHRPSSFNSRLRCWCSRIFMGLDEGFCPRLAEVVPKVHTPWSLHETRLFVNIVLFYVLPRFYGYKSCFTFYSWAFESSIDHNLLYLESNVPTTYDPIATMRSDTLKILATTTTATAAATTAAAATTTAWNACNNSTQQQASLSIGLFAKILILELPKLHVDHVSRSTLGNHPETRSVP